MYDSDKLADRQAAQKEWERLEPEYIDAWEEYEIEQYRNEHRNDLKD